MQDKILAEFDESAVIRQRLGAILSNYVFEDKSDYCTRRLRIYLCGEYSVSIIRGKFTYGGDKGLYEMALFTGQDICYDNPFFQSYGVRGHLTTENVVEIMENIIQWVEKIKQND